MASLLILVAVLALPLTVTLTAVTWHFVPLAGRGRGLDRARRWLMLLAVYSSAAMLLFVNCMQHPDAPRAEQSDGGVPLVP